MALLFPQRGSFLCLAFLHRYPIAESMNHHPLLDRRVPSRMTFSELASASSTWGQSGGVSQMMVHSEGGVTWGGSPTISVPRITVSVGSTSQTSVATSSAQPTTIQLVKQKQVLSEQPRRYRKKTPSSVVASKNLRMKITPSPLGTGATSCFPAIQRSHSGFRLNSNGSGGSSVDLSTQPGSVAISAPPFLDTLPRPGNPQVQHRPSPPVRRTACRC